MRSRVERIGIPSAAATVHQNGANLGAKMKNDMGQITVGDVKGFRLTVNVITGYEKLDGDPEPAV